MEVIIVGNRTQQEAIDVATIAALNDKGYTVASSLDDTHLGTVVKDKPIFVGPGFSPLATEALDMINMYKNVYLEDVERFAKDFYHGVPKWARGRKCEPVRTKAKVMRNDPCPCGSGLKAKKCCYR